MRYRVPVLMYHAVHHDRSIISISPSEFGWQMAWLHDRGYRVLTLRRIVGYLSEGISLPDRSIVLTFDDGFENLYTTAFPILTRYGFSGTVFLVAGYCGKQSNWPGQPLGVSGLPLLDWKQILEMDRHGFEFGSHTVTHRRLDRITPDDMRNEILSSKAMIEDQLGHSVESFAYPYGRFNGLVKSVVQGAFLGACSTRLGLVGANSDPFELERIEIHYLRSRLLFRGLSASILPLYLTLRRCLRTVASVALKRDWH